MTASSAGASAAANKIGDLPAASRKAIRAWCMYDWANSAFATSGVAAIFPAYFVYLFNESLGDGAALFGIAFTGSSVWSLAVALSTAAVAASSPVLGVIADRVPIKKTLLWVYTVLGSAATFLMFFSAYFGQPWAWMIAMFALANAGFAGSLVFYNAFLPHLAPRDLHDDVSSRGFAYGYIGGGLLLLVHLIAIQLTSGSDIADLVTRGAMASVGVWWFGWALWTLRAVPEPPIDRPTRGLGVFSATALALRELRRTFRDISRFRVLALYLASYLLFNDGLQTVLAIAGAFAADTIRIPLIFIMGTILIIQFIGAPGAMAFGWLARRISTKRALIISLWGWVLLVLFGVAVAPLVPKEHADYEYQLSAANGGYVVESAPDSERPIEWEGESWTLSEGDNLTERNARAVLEAARNSPDFSYSASVSGGALDGDAAIGAKHPSQLGAGPIDWWPRMAREAVWEPLGINAGFQWLLLGLFVGIVIGGSQALARSLFSQITPDSRSGEFFSFFGFMTRASSVFGPTLYVFATAVFDTRVAVVSILLLIAAGTVALRWVNVAEGARVADAEEARLRGDVTP